MLSRRVRSSYVANSRTSSLVLIFVHSSATAAMDAASIEQMNKVRVSLGMAPLPVPGKTSEPQFKQGAQDESDEDDKLSTLDKRQALAGSNWQKLEDEKRDRIERQKRKEAAKKARDAAQRFAVLEGKGLGEADETDEVDTRTWLLQQKKRQKKIEKQRQKLEQELAEREQQAEYTSKDLAGVKVGHEANQFDELTGEQILTLKDAEIGEESEDDELENAELKAKEKLEEKLALKIRKPDYDPTDMDEQRGLLSKYDDEINGKKQKVFKLDGKGTLDAETQERLLHAKTNSQHKGVKINLDMLKDDAAVSDYVDPSTVKIKKPKKSKKEKKTRQKAVDEDDIFPTVAPSTKMDTNDMDVDTVTMQRANGEGKKRVYDFDDDDDLQAKLAEQRRQALKKRKRLDGSEIVRQLRDEMPVDDEEVEEGGLVVDETSEFVANLKKPEASAAQSSKGDRLDTPDNKDVDGDTAMQSYADAEEAAERAERREREESAPATEMTATGLEEESSMNSQGLGASLAMLRRRGLIDNPAAADLAQKERARAEFLASKQGLLDDYDRRAREQREYDRKSGKLDRMSNRDRDAYARQQNEQREAYIAKLLAEKFNREYRPDIKLEYHDEFGRQMNQKEAFKHMSHMFHGKGSGKLKTEKRLKKIEDEKREEGRGVLGGGEGGMAEVQGREGRRQKQAGVRLQ
nr:u4/u6.u5 tri-snrnp-associated protein snu66 [Quercus suber]